MWNISKSSLCHLGGPLSSESARPATFKLGLAYLVAADSRLSRRHW